MPKMLIFEYIGIIAYVLIPYLVKIVKGKQIDKNELLEKFELASALFIFMGIMCTIGTQNLK